MRKLLAIIVFGVVFGVYWQVSAESISANVAVQQMPTPTFEDVHRAYFRITTNEAPFYSVPDHDGILRSLLFGGGGRRHRAARAGTGYGLDYIKLMKRMIAHSPRTFPANSKFLVLSPMERQRHRARQTSRNLWSSTMQLDCSEPAGWAQFAPGKDWKRLYGKRCRFAVHSTGLFLKGLQQSQCDGKPTTWGNEKDTYRPGGAADSGWKEIFCNRASREECAHLTAIEHLNSKVCAKNRFWTWLVK